MYSQISDKSLSDIRVVVSGYSNKSCFTNDRRSFAVGDNVSISTITSLKWDCITVDTRVIGLGIKVSYIELHHTQVNGSSQRKRLMGSGC